LSEVQLGFATSKRTTDHIFVIKTEVINICRLKVVELAVFGGRRKKLLIQSVGFKMRKKRVSENMVSIKKMYEGTIFCVNCEDDRVKGSVEQRGVVRQGCSLSPRLFDVCTYDAVDYINEGNNHASAAGKLSVAGLLVADDLAISSFTVNGLQKGVDGTITTGI
jgi:hypothetical protein